MINLLDIWLLVVGYHLIFLLTYVLAFNSKYRLSQINAFNRKPFSCWKCLNFWVMLFISINIAWFNLYCGAVGLLLTICFTAVLILDNNP